MVRRPSRLVQKGVNGVTMLECLVVCVIAQIFLLFLEIGPPQKKKKGFYEFDGLDCPFLHCRLLFFTPSHTQLQHAW